MKTSINILLFFLILFGNGCYVENEISTYRELLEVREDGEIQIVTKDTTVYYVESFNITDTTVIIKGTKVKDNLESEFSGTLNYEDIAYIQNFESSLIGTLAFAGATGLIAGYGVPILTETEGLEAAIKIIYPSHGGGCSPY